MQIWMPFYFSDVFGSSPGQGGSESVNIMGTLRWECINCAHY